MDTYKSIYTGEQVDKAVEKALTIDSLLTGYLKNSDINIKVPGFTADNVINDRYLPVGSADTKGVFKVGSGLVTEGAVLSIDSSMYYDKTYVDTKLDEKLDKTLAPKKLSDLINDLTVIEVVSTKDDEYKLVITDKLN
jgi:hypothetical protein